MAEIKALTHLDADALKPVITGYVSPAKYEVEKMEARELTSITLRLVRLSRPYVKRYDHLDEETLARYARVLKDGFSFGAYEAGRMIGVALAEPHGWNKSLWVLSYYTNDDMLSGEVAIFMKRRLT